MRRLAVVPLMLVLGIACSVGIASATPAKHGLGYAMGIQGTPAPTEWAGVWDTQDSSYIFCGGPGTVSTGKDTICANESIDPPGNDTFTCSGSADGTTFHQHCTGTDTSGGCDAAFDMTMDGTRTGDNYTIVTMTYITLSGAGAECTGTFCQRYVSYGTRTGPAPVDYCTTTAVKPASWGQLKMLYR